MILDQDNAKKIAKILLQINAIKLNPKNPFIWASGWKSPIYCDNRIILSHPKTRLFIRNEISNQINKFYEKPEIIAGVATGAIGIGILVADLLKLPFVYVRPSAKKHGRENQIEGTYQKGQSVVVIEDLISTGNSSLMAVDALRNAELNINGMISIFSYGLPISFENFKNKNVKLNSLSSYDILLKQAYESGYINVKEHEILSQWKKNPQEWGLQK
ncbi:MAG: orotate phosphoribosyltransferase [Flavobacteriaceae bacterium]|nr:orotate phosphoribosyltransferase [Flavobacteriaceae bacterium]